MGFAVISIVGNLGQDPEMRYTPSGKPVTDLNVAVNQSKRDPNGNWTDDTNWYRCQIWGDAALRAAEQLHRGSKVAVSGGLKVRDWHSNKTGKDGYSLEINVNQWQNLDPRAREEGSFAPAAAGSGGDNGGAAAPDPDSLDDLPF